jgi:hypothetical protein
MQRKSLQVSAGKCDTGVRRILESIPQRFWSISSFIGDDFLLFHAADQDSDASAAPHPTLAVTISACRYCDGELVPRAESIASAEGCPPVRKATMPLAR